MKTLLIYQIYQESILQYWLSSKFKMWLIRKSIMIINKKSNIQNLLNILQNACNRLKFHNHLFYLIKTSLTKIFIY